MFVILVLPLVLKSRVKVSFVVWSSKSFILHWIYYDFFFVGLKRWNSGWITFSLTFKQKGKVKEKRKEEEQKKNISQSNTELTQFKEIPSNLISTWYKLRMNEEIIFGNSLLIQPELSVYFISTHGLWHAEKIFPFFLGKKMDLCWNKSFDKPLMFWIRLQGNEIRLPPHVGIAHRIFCDSKMLLNSSTYIIWFTFTLALATTFCMCENIIYAWSFETAFQITWLLCTAFQYSKIVQAHENQITVYNVHEHKKTPVYIRSVIWHVISVMKCTKRTNTYDFVFR